MVGSGSLGKKVAPFGILDGVDFASCASKFNEMILLTLSGAGALGVDLFFGSQRSERGLLSRKERQWHEPSWMSWIQRGE
jgi:hypothetical protein